MADQQDSQFEVVDGSQVQEMPASGTQQAASSQMTAQPQQQFEVVGGDSVQELPQLANGMSPKTPVNVSPVSIDDRFKMALGNERGNMDYLKTKFEAVQKIEDGPLKGNLVVKDKGLWHMVDGKTLGTVDAWTATKGIVKGMGAAAQVLADRLSGVDQLSKQTKKFNVVDSVVKDDPMAKETASEIVENVPTAAAIGLSTAAGVATGGGSLLAQAAGAGLTAAASELTKTSLGRLEGTYQATPEEQMKDVALETMLNFGGVYVAAGVKPTATFVADNLGKLATKMKLPNAAGIIKKGYAAITVGEDNFDTMLEHTDDVRSAMKVADSVAKTGAEYTDHLTNNSIQEVKKAAQSSQGLLSDIYKGLSKAISGNVDDAFKADVQQVTSGIFKKAVDDGYVVLRKGNTLLSAAESAVEIANAGGRIPAGFSPVTRSLEEIKALVKTTGAMDGAEIAFDAEAHAAMSKFFETAKDMHQIPSLNGKAGFDQLMKFNKILDDATFKIKTSAGEQGLAAVERQMAQYHSIVRDSMRSKLEERGLGKMFDHMQSTYSAMKDQMAPLLAARDSAAKGAGDKPYEALLTRMAAKPGKNIASKESLNGAIAAAKQYGSAYATVFEQTQKAVRVNQAAIAFNPLVRADFVGRGSLTMALGAAASGNLGVAASLGAGAAVTSPTIAKHVVIATQAMKQGRQFMNAQGPGFADKLLQNPGALNAFVSATMQTPLIQEQVKNQLLNQAGVPVK